MQLMPDTAAELAHTLGLDPTVCSPAAPHLNIRMGIAYERKCWDMWKKETGIDCICFMLGSYTAGPGDLLDAQDLAGRSGLATNRWMSIASILPEITSRHARETISYVQRIESLFSDITMERIVEGFNTE